MKLVINLKSIRMNKGLTQLDLARLLGFKREVQISQVETGRQLPRIDKALKFAKALKVNVEDLWELQ